AGALAGHAHLLAAADACRDLDVHRAARPLPAAAVARRTRLAADIAGAVAGRAGLVHLELEALARTAVGLLERDRHAGLDVVAAGAAPREAAAPVLESAAPEAGRTATAGTDVTE